VKIARDGSIRSLVRRDISLSAAVIALSAGLAIGQSAPSESQDAGASTPRSGTAGAAASMVPDQDGKPQARSRASKGGDDEKVGGDIKVDANQIVDLHVKDEELIRVLELLAIQSQRNIIPTKSVNSRVSANLYGVTFYEALDALLHPNGYGYVERNNRIEVYTLEEIKAIEAASRVRIAKVLRLNYLNAVDAAAFVEALLSDGGQIKTNGKTGTFNIPEKAPVGADEYANDSMLVVYDYEENVAEIERLIKEIDTRPSQVLVEATILQTQLNEANAFGVDFSILGDLDFGDFAGAGGPLTAVNGLIAGKSKTLGSGDIPLPGSDSEGRAIVSNPGNTSGPGTIKLGLVDQDVAVFLKMLDEVGDTSIISSPKVLALNRQPARVLVGRKVGYLSTTSTDTTTTQSVEFLDTGTQLYFRPFVTNEGLIRLELKPAVSEAVIRDTRDATGAAVTIPDEITNEIVTNVIVRDGQTVVLGGLFRESTESSRRQVPFLGDIPILGAAFRGHDDETSRNEIIFMITPSIVSDQVLVMQGERGNAMVDRVRTGSREGLLPWSRERMTGQLLVEAERLADEGKDDEALWKIQQSLAMNHNQPEAIALRERLTNKKSNWPGRSMLDSIVRDEAGLKPGADASNGRNTPRYHSGKPQHGVVPTAIIGPENSAPVGRDPNHSSTVGAVGSIGAESAPANSTSIGADLSSTPSSVASSSSSTDTFHTAGQASTVGGQDAQSPDGIEVITAPSSEIVEVQVDFPAAGATSNSDSTAIAGDATTPEFPEILGEFAATTNGSAIQSPDVGLAQHDSTSNASGDLGLDSALQGDGSTAMLAGSSDPNRHAAAWAWFYTGFREFFVPMQFDELQMPMAGTELIEPAPGESPQGEMTSVPDSDE
jgi:type IV pilus assembly protein PilQ